MTSIIPYYSQYQGHNSYNSQQVTNPNSYPPPVSPQNMVYKSQYIKETGIIKPGRPKASDFFGNYDCTNYENGEIIENTTKLKKEFKKELDDIKKINIELEKRLYDLKKSSDYSRGRSRERYSRRNSRERSRKRYSDYNSRRNSRSRSRERYSHNSSRRNSRSRSRERYSRNSSRRNSRSRTRERYSRNSSRRNSRERSDTKKCHNISIGQYKITPCKYGHNCKHRYAYIHRKGDDCTYLHEGDRDDKNNLVPVSREMAMRLYLKYKNNK